MAEAPPGPVDPISAPAWALAVIAPFNYGAYAAVVLGLTALVAVTGYLGARRWHPASAKAITIVALLLGGAALVPAPEPTTSPRMVTGELTGHAVLTLDGSDQAPLLVRNGTGDRVSGDGPIEVELVCPEGCTFQIGSLDERDASMELASRNVTLEGGPLTLQVHGTFCRAEPWILNVGAPPCASTGWSSYRAPEGSNGTVRLNATGGVAA